MQRDSKHCGEFTSSTVEWVEPSSAKPTVYSYAMKTKFFSPIKNILVKCELTFSNQDGMLLYPFGDVRCKFDLVFGNAEYYLLTSTAQLLKTVSKLKNGPLFAVRCCKAIRDWIEE